jgi:hypothetical protein
MTCTSEVLLIIPFRLSRLAGIPLVRVAADWLPQIPQENSIPGIVHTWLIKFNLEAAWEYQL